MPIGEKTDITPLGFCNFRNGKKKFGIKLDDRRRHVYVIGKTGVGKTTLLENMAIADMRAGKGLGIIDPHGEFAERIVDFVPEERLDDVIYVNPADMEYPIAFNPMEQVGAEFRHLVASGLMGVFKKIFVDVWSARMAYILNNTLLALLEYPGSTLLGIMRMYAEPAYRKTIVDNLKDPVVKAFWVGEYAKYTQRLESEAVAAIQNKIGQFVSNPLIRNILGQPNSTLNMREIMDSGKILIVNLSKGRVGEDNSALLGAMIITRLQLAAMSRVDTDERKRKDFFLYVDEFQNFATDSFANILSEARKYRLSLVLAHQYIGQLISGDNNTKMRDAVFGNVGTIVNFRIGAADAEFLEKEFMPEFLQNDLVNLAKYNAYMKLMIDGVASRPFSAETEPPQKLPLVSYRDVIVENSRRKYSTPRKVVEARIASEWEVTSSALVQDKLDRRGERPLRQTLNGPPRERVSRQYDDRSRASAGEGDEYPRMPLRNNSHSGSEQSVERPRSMEQHPIEHLRPMEEPRPAEHPRPAPIESHHVERPIENPRQSARHESAGDSAGRPMWPSAAPLKNNQEERRTPPPIPHTSVHPPIARRTSEDIVPKHVPPPLRFNHTQGVSLQKELGAFPPQQKIHPKPNVNIDDLRKAISESLNKKKDD